MADEKQQEYDALLARAASMGLDVPEGTSLEKLRKVVNAKLKGEDEPMKEETPAQEEPSSLQEQVEAECLKLRRVIITPNNPAEKDLNGILVTVGNSVIPTIRKFVDFGVPYHIPQIIYDVMKEKQYQFFGSSSRENDTVVRSCVLD